MEVKKPTRFIDAEEVLRRFPFCKSTLENNVRAGRFPQSVKIGKRRFWSADEVDAYAEQLLAERPKAA